MCTYCNLSWSKVYHVYIAVSNGLNCTMCTLQSPWSKLYHVHYNILWSKLYHIYIAISNGQNCAICTYCNLHDHVHCNLLWFKFLNCTAYSAIFHGLNCAMCTLQFLMVSTVYKVHWNLPCEQIISCYSNIHKNLYYVQAYEFSEKFFCIWSRTSLNSKRGLGSYRLLGSYSFLGSYRLLGSIFFKH